MPVVVTCRFAKFSDHHKERVPFLIRRGHMKNKLIPLIVAVMTKQSSQLNKLGADGWELVGVLPSNNLVVLYLKRAK
jgi:hypothetical protein